MLLQLACDLDLADPACERGESRRPPCGTARWPLRMTVARAQFLVLAVLSGGSSAARTNDGNCSLPDVYEDGAYDLSGCVVTTIVNAPVDASALAFALTGSRGRSVSSLQLSKASLDPDSIEHLAGAFEHHPSLQSLIIDNNDIGPSGAHSIATALRNNNLVRRLTIGKCKIQDDGAAAMADLLRHNSAIREVDLAFNDIYPAGIMALADALVNNSRVLSLDLSANPIYVEGSAELAKALKQNSVLQALNLRASAIGDEGLALLASALRVNKGLQHIDLWATNINDDGATALGSALKKNRALKEVNLWDNNVTDVGAEAIAEGLRYNRALAVIRLGRNEGLTDGAAVSFVQTFKTNKVLTFVDFGTTHTQVTSEFDEALMKAGKCNAEKKSKICREEALAKLPMRVSVRDMMSASGIDPDKRRAENIAKAKKLAEIEASLTPEQLEEVKKLNAAHVQREREEAEQKRTEHMNLNILQGLDPKTLSHLDPDQVEAILKMQAEQATNAKSKQGDSKRKKRKGAVKDEI